jgi:hypothetical protein
MQVPPFLALPKSEDDFQQMMLQLDLMMQASDIPIANRALRAILLVGTLVPGVPVLGGATREPRDGRYDGEDLIIRTCRWFDAKYGQAQAATLRLGKTVTLVASSAFLIRIPIVYGEI